jgi:hypothetical protein
VFRRLNVVSKVALAELNLGFFTAEQECWESACEHFDAALGIAHTDPTTVADLLRSIVGFSLAKSRSDVAMAYASRLSDSEGKWRENRRLRSPRRAGARILA